MLTFRILLTFFDERLANFTRSSKEKYVARENIWTAVTGICWSSSGSSRIRREFVPKASPVSAVESRLIFSLGGRVFNRVCTVISRRRERRGRKVKKSSRNPDRMFLHFPTGFYPAPFARKWGGREFLPCPFNDLLPKDLAERKVAKVCRFQNALCAFQSRFLNVGFP